MAKKTRLQKKRNYKQKSRTRVKKTRVKRAGKKRVSRKLYGGATSDAVKTDKITEISEISEGVYEIISQKFDQEFVDSLDIEEDQKTKMKSLSPKLKFKMVTKMFNNEIEPYEYEKWFKDKFDDIANNRTLKHTIQRSSASAFSLGVENELRQFHKEKYQQRYKHFLNLVKDNTKPGQSDTEYLIEQYFTESGVDVLIEIGKLLKTRTGLTKQLLMYYMNRIFYIKGKNNEIELINTHLILYELTDPKTRTGTIEEFKETTIYRDNKELLDNENLFMFFLQSKIKRERERKRKETTSLDALIQKVLRVFTLKKSPANVLDKIKTGTDKNLLYTYFTYLNNFCENIKKTVKDSHKELNKSLLDEISRIDGKSAEGELKLFIVSYYYYMIHPDQIFNTRGDVKLLEKELYNILTGKDITDKELYKSKEYNCIELYATDKLTQLPIVINEEIEEEQTEEKIKQTRKNKKVLYTAVITALAEQVKHSNMIKEAGQPNRHEAPYGASLLELYI